MGTSPVFNEVIGVSFDTQSFTESVQALQDIWQKAMAEMSGQSPITGVANMDAMTEALTRTAENLKSLGATYAESVTKVSGSVTETVTKQAAELEEKVKSSAISAKQAAINVVNELAEAVKDAHRLGDEQAKIEAKSRFNNASSKFLTSDGNPQDLSYNSKAALYYAMQEDQEKGTKNIGPDFESLNAMQRQWYTQFAQVMAQADDRMVEHYAKQTELEAKANAEAEAYQQRLGVQQAQAQKEDEQRTAAKLRGIEQEEANAQRMGVIQTQAQKEDEQRTAARAKAIEQEEAATQRMGVLQTSAVKEDEQRTAAKLRTQAQAEAHEQHMGVLQAAAAKEDAARTAAKARAIEQEEAAQRRLGLLQVAAEKEDQRIAEAKLKALEKQEEAAKRVARAQEGAGKKDTSSGGSFSSSFKDAFSGESVGNLVGMTVAWAGIGAAIGAAYKAAEGLVGLFKSGWEYSQQLEQSAAKLQGVIASNVKLSQDAEQNFRLAGEAADQLQRKFEDASIKYGISVEVLERGFKNLVDNGGVSLVRNLDEAQKLSVLFGAAIQANGKDADTTRAILSDLPKMLDGTEKPSSLILKTTKLNNKEWDALVKNAKIHHDLLDQMAPRMAEYAKVAEQAGNRQEALTQSIGLEIKRIMADAEHSPFAGWTQVLQQVKGYLEENKERLTAFLQVIVESFVSFGRVIGAVGNLIAAIMGVKDGWTAVMLIIATILETTNILKDSVAAVTNVLAKFVALTNGQTSWQGFKAAAKDAVDYTAKQFDELGKKTNEGAKRLYAIASGKSFDGQNPSNALTLPPGPGSKVPTDLSKEKTNNDPLHELEKQQAAESAISKKKYDQEIEQTKLLLAQRNLSTQEADDAMAKSAQEEYQRQTRILEVVRDKAALLKGIKPASLTEFNTKLGTQQTNLDDVEQKRLSEVQIDSTRKALAEQDKADAEAIDSFRKFTDDKIAEIKRAEQAGIDSHRRAIAEEENALRAEQVGINSHYDAEIARAGKNEELLKSLTSQKAQSDEKFTAQYDELSTRRIQVSMREFEAGQKVALEQAKLERDKVVNKTRETRRSNNPTIGAQSSLEAANAQVRYTASVVQSKQAELDQAKTLHASTDALQQKQKALDDAKDKQDEAKSNADIAKQQLIDKSPEGAAVINVGVGLKDTLSDFSSGFTESVQNMGEAINVFHGSVNNIVQALEKGGILGAAGASASTAGGLVSSLGQTLGKAVSSFAAVGGPMLSAVGTLFTAVSAIFQQEAQDIANTIEKNLTNANNAYQNQTATLIQTLQAVQEQRQNAINQLSGIKGGQDQLDKLLPQIDQEIAQLQLQIKEAMITFTNSLQDLTLDNTALSSAFDKWQQINQQVQAYLSAGGDVAKANQYISESLEAMKQAAGDTLNQGYQTAIADAINLNNLIQQRMQMERQEAETEFNTINGDALERRGTKAIDTGTQLQQEKAQYQQQMDALNSTIDLTQQKVNLEGQMFNLAQSTAQLQQTSNNLQIEQLKEQLAILQAQKDIYNGISQGSNGQYQMSNTLMNEIGVVNIIVQSGGTAGDDSAASAQATSDAVSSVLNTWSRYGFGSYIAKT